MKVQRGHRKIVHCELDCRDYLGRVDWQQITALFIVAGAAVALVWGRVHRRRFSFERDSHCGCSAANNSTAQGSIIFRARKGERPQVLMKMK